MDREAITDARARLVEGINELKAARVSVPMPLFRALHAINHAIAEAEATQEARRAG